MNPLSAVPLTDSPDCHRLSSYDVFQRIGVLTRRVHDALRELGYDGAINEAVKALPDARDRLAYVASLTGRAAERALTAAEAGRDIQNALAREALALAERETAESTRAFLARVAESATNTNAQFTEIMLAQDFHDLSGQVINRVVALASMLEEQLVKLLLEASPPDQRVRLADQPGFDGPVIDAAGRSDVVTSQAQVDELLASLGF